MRPFLPEPDLSERIHDAVLDAICSGELKSGARITQEELAQQFGVSRQPVLQAMMLLRREGFLIESGRKGVCVAPLDVQQARNLYVVRAALDGAAARLAAALSEGDLRVSVWDEHEGILRALEAGQASEAEALCRGHAEQMADILTGRLKVVISRAA